MDKILIPVLIVAGIGLLAGIILAVASAIMAVPKDEKAEAILEVLPGANCGACGFSGCSGYAAALSKGEAQPGLCSPGGEACAKACAELLGTGDVAVEKKTALVHCMGSYDCTSDKMRYDGIDSCAASTLLAGGISSCRYGCMGMGDCAAVCEYGAINVCNGMASIDPAKCRGCAKCTAACPKGLISFVPLKKQAVVRCSNCDKGAETMKVCKVGCIGCGKCMKACEVGAVKVTNFCAKVDPAKCIGCGKCAEVCPRHVITMLDASFLKQTEPRLCAGAFLLSKFAIRSLQISENPLYYTKHGSPKFFLRCAAKQLFRSEHKASPRVSRKWIEVYSADRFCAFCASCIFGREHFCFACFIKTGGVLCRHA